MRESQGSIGLRDAVKEVDGCIYGAGYLKHLNAKTCPTVVTQTFVPPTVVLGLVSRPQRLSGQVP